MAGGKLNARQKMINLMYLVFIAMMALNIDREVLRAFDDVNVSLQKTNNVVEQNNAAFMKTITNKAKDDPEYAQTFEKATAVREKANDLAGYLDILIGKLNSTEGKVEKEEEGPNYNKLANLEVVTNLFFKNENSYKEDGSTLIEKIKSFNEYLDTAGKEGKSYKSAFGINIEDVKIPGEAKKKSWLTHKFYGQPKVAAETILTKLKMDVKSAESQIIRDMMSQKLLEDLEVNEFRPVVFASSYVAEGSKESGQVAIGAFDNRVLGTANIDGYGSFPLSGGAATFPLKSSKGKHTIKGSLSFKDAKGNTKTAAIEPFTYEVVSNVIKDTPTGGVVSADYMNVVYIGVDNPMTATVNGTDSDVSLSASTGAVSRKGSGKFNYRVSGGAGQKVTFTVSAKTNTGKTISDKKEFRIKSVPKAIARVRGRPNSNVSMPASSVKHTRISVEWPDFEFPVTGEVLSMVVKPSGQRAVPVNGSSLGSAAEGLKRGDDVQIFDIKYRTNFGETRVADNPITIQCK